MADKQSVGPAGDRIVTVPERVKKAATYVRRNPDGTSASLLTATGAAFAIVGLVDLALLWFPLRFGSPAWEFGTLSRTFDSLPMTGLGMALVAFGLVRHPEWHPAWVRGAAILFALVTIGMVLLGVVYGLAAVVVVGQTPAEGLDALGRAILKNGVEIVVYSLVFGAIAVMLWRGVEKVA